MQKWGVLDKTEYILYIAKIKTREDQQLFQFFIGYTMEKSNMEIFCY